MSIAPPVFVVGCMRSGTTVLHEMLMRYCPGAVDIDDDDFEGRTFWQRRGYSIGSPRTGTPCDAHNGTGVTRDRTDEMRAYLSRRTRDVRHVINKNPHLSNKIGLVAAVFPETRIVHLVRDDLAVAASTKLHLLSLYEGQNFYGTRFVHYWPAEGAYPCWACIPGGSMGGWQPLRQRLGRLLRGRRTPPMPHDDPAEFRRRHPDPSRYYPGEGFRRIPESWLRLNANIIRQVEASGLERRYLAIGYADLVEHPRNVLARIAAFAGIDRTAPDQVPAALDAARGERWRTTLTKAELGCVAAAAEEIAADAALIRDRLPGPLFTSRG
jgi:sulfotransferase family protein